ncbi:MAG: type-F conjugative transfer system secretin TraK [Syntrophales bacterium]|nr:type-F conjugative transfer system secretin TraK [Syntrophales bacterium]MDD5532760.1 type-F conjugative transfer system secretin TraK [Syntrophales bacterium]
MRLFAVLISIIVLFTAVLAEIPGEKGPGPTSPPGNQTHPRIPAGKSPGPVSRGKLSVADKKQGSPAGTVIPPGLQSQKIPERLQKNQSPGPDPAGCSGEICSKRDVSIFEAAGMDTGRHRVEKTGYAEIARAVESANMPIIVVPEMPAAIRLSRSDVNRITCAAGDIRDVVFSKEKGISVSFSGKDAYLKYRYVRRGGRDVYPPATEIFIICGEATYNIIAVPERIPAQTVRLSGSGGDRIKKNREFFSGMSSEKKIITLIKAVYTDDIPESFTVEAVNRRLPRLFRDVDIRLNRIVVADGEGLRLKEYVLTVAGSSPREKIEFDEKDFLNADLTAGTAAVSMDRLTIRRGESARLFICETGMDVQDNISAKGTMLRIDKKDEEGTSGERVRKEVEPKSAAPQGVAAGRAPAPQATGHGGRR